jgi:hypothetical protein
MEDCIFPLEIIENIASYDVFVAYNIKATCRGLKELRAPTKPKKICNVYRKWTHKTINRIVYQLETGQAVDYYQFGDWHIHNYYNDKTDVYDHIVSYNYRLRVHDIKKVRKMGQVYYASGLRTVLEMEPRMNGKNGFDYTYYIGDTETSKYVIRIMVRPDRATWTYVKFE